MNELYLVASEIENQISEHDQGRGENMESSRNILRALLHLLCSEAQHIPELAINQGSA